MYNMQSSYISSQSRYVVSIFINIIQGVVQTFKWKQYPHREFSGRGIDNPAELITNLWKWMEREEEMEDL